MADAFTGEIRAFGFNYPPVDWAMCNGQPMVATQYQALFSLIGTTYGSSGQPNFNLPDLRGRVPMSQGSSGGSTPPKIGTTSGEEQVTLTASQGPAHSHTLNVSGAVAGTSGVTLSNQPTVNVSYPSEISAKSGRGSITSVSFFSNASPNAILPGGTISPAGTSGPHENRQPYLVLNFCICVNGIYPPFDS